MIFAIRKVICGLAVRILLMMLVRSMIVLATVWLWMRSLVPAWRSTICAADEVAQVVAELAIRSALQPEWPSWFWSKFGYLGAPLLTPVIVPTKSTLFPALRSDCHRK